jgi:hypothetical protein
MLKTGAKAQAKQYNKPGQEASSFLWRRKWSGEHCLLIERKFLRLTMADVLHLANQLAVRKGIKNQFYKRNFNRLEESGWKMSYFVIKKFQLQPLKVVILKGKGFHFWISSSVSLNIWTRYFHHST